MGQYFILDPAFPERLTRSGYYRTLDFIERLFEDYAQAGLSRRSDKEVAISGLLQRIGTALNSQFVYGVFECIRWPLILWRALDSMNNEAVSASMAAVKLPSWSWMSYDHIEFLDTGEMDIAQDTIRFGIEKQQLDVYIFDVQDCSMAPRSDLQILVNSSDEEIQKVWFDSNERIETPGCVIVARRRRKNDFLYDLVRDKKEVFVLFVVAEGQGQYRRVGVGEISLQYISQSSVRGVLV
jgi:hypothetical protein